MRDIKDILKLFANNYNMDYCEDFDIIKGVLEYCDEHFKRISKIQNQGGNEQVINEIVSRIRSHLAEKSYFEEDSKPSPKFDHQLRKITLFLALNTDSTYKFNLKDDDNIVHVLEVIPQLPKRLLIYLIWGLSLEEYFYELLSYAPCWFAFQFYEPAVSSIKPLNPYEVLEKVDNLVRSMYTNICRIDYISLDTVDKKRICRIYYDHTMELLRQFYTPDMDKFSNWTKRQFFKYSGFAIRHLLNMVLFCFDNFEDHIKAEIDEKLEVYSIGTNLCPYSTPPDTKYSNLIRENQNKIIMTLLNSLQYNVMLVTIDIFMYWVEVNAEGSNLQVIVGEKAYLVLERMSNNKAFGHDVQDQLKFIAIKPKTLEESIKDACMGEVLRKIEDCATDANEKKMWFDELINNRQISLGNDESLETIRGQLKFMTVSNCTRILDYLKIQLDYMDEPNDFKYIHEGAISLLLDSLQNFDRFQLTEIIHYRNKEFGLDTKLFEQSNLSERTVEFFNKWVNVFDTTEFLTLAFENPRFCYKQFLVAALHSEEQVKNFLVGMTQTRKLSKLFIDDLVDYVMNKKYEERLYSKLIYGIYDSDHTYRTSIFKSHVYPNVVSFLESMNLEPLKALLKAMVLIASKCTADDSDFNSVKAPVLVMAGQIMEKCRWDMLSYSDLKEEIVRLAIEFVQVVSKKFLPRTNEEDKCWIRKKVAGFRPINQFYYQKYSLSVTEQPKTFDRFLHPEGYANEAETHKFLTSVYVRCTVKETEWLARCDRLLPHITDVVLVIEEIANDLGNSAINNFRHCVLNYVNIVRKYLIPMIANDQEKVPELGFKMLNIVGSSPLAIYEEIFMIFQNVLLEVFQQTEPIEDDVIREVRKFLSKMKDCKGKELFSEKFAAMSFENQN